MVTVKRQRIEADSNYVLFLNGNSPVVVLISRDMGYINMTVSPPCRFSFTPNMSNLISYDGVSDAVEELISRGYTMYTKLPSMSGRNIGVGITYILYNKMHGLIVAKMETSGIFRLQTDTSLLSSNIVRLGAVGEVVFEQVGCTYELRTSTASFEAILRTIGLDGWGVYTVRW